MCSFMSGDKHNDIDQPLELPPNRTNLPAVIMDIGCCMSRSVIINSKYTLGYDLGRRIFYQCRRFVLHRASCIHKWRRRFYIHIQQCYIYQVDITISEQFYETKKIIQVSSGLDSEAQIILLTWTNTIIIIDFVKPFNSHFSKKKLSQFFITVNCCFLFFSKMSYDKRYLEEFSFVRLCKIRCQTIKQKIRIVCENNFENWCDTTNSCKSIYVKEELCKSGRFSAILLTLFPAMCTCFQWSHQDNNPWSSGKLYLSYMPYNEYICVVYLS